MEPVFRQQVFHTTSLASKPLIEAAGHINAVTPSKRSEYDGEAMLREDAPPIAYVLVSALPPPMVSRFNQRFGSQTGCVEN